MNTIFKSLLRKCVLVFFDDILVYSKTIEEHKNHLRIVMGILEEHHFFIKASKCAFMEKELEYLGHFISGEGVKVDQRKIEAMVDWPLPNDISALRGFLGLTGYYRRFVKNYGLIAKPLTSLLKKDNFSWTQEAREAFEELKRAMTTTPVLALPNFEKPFEVYTDASGEGIGAVLVQDKRPIAFISKALGPMKKAWSTYAREMLAVVHAVKVWRPYLLGRKFTIITDQQALRHMLQQKIVTPEQQKFLVKLLGFEYEIVYQPGKENKVADALSRKEGSAVLWLVHEEEEVSLMALSGAEWHIWDKIREATSLDARALEIVELLEAQGGGVANYKFKDGLIHYKDYIYVPNVPSLRREILDHFHNSKEGGHSEWLRTYMRVKHFFYWEGIKKAVKKLVAECDTCQKVKYDTRPPSGLLQPLPIPNMIWEELSMDFVEGLPISGGHEVILVVVDRLSKYAHFIPLIHPYTAKSVAKAFVDNVVRLHGFPKSIVTDRDRVFMSTFWKELFELQGSKLKSSSSYHPQTDGQTEVVNRTLEQYLRCFCHEEQRRWGDYLTWAEYWYNTAYHSSIQRSPFEVVYGRSPPTLVSYERGTAKNEEVEKELLARDEILVKVKKELKRAQERMKRYYDQGRRGISFEVGDYVYLKLQPYGQMTLRKKLNLKLSKRYHGPFKVLEKLSDVAYRLELPPTSKLHPVFHITVLKKRVGDPRLIVEELPKFDEEGRMLLQPREALEYRVVTRGRKRRKVWQVLIRWGGVPREEATWEDYEDMESRFPQFILEGKDSLEGGGNVKNPCKKGHGQVAYVLALVSTHLATTPRASLGHAMAQATSPHGPAQLAQPTMRTALQANHARALAKHMASQHAQPDREPCLARGQQAAQASHAGNQAKHSAGSYCPPRPAHACQASHARGPANPPTGPTRPVRPVRPHMRLTCTCQAQPTRPVRPHMRLACTCPARLTRPARPHMRAARQDQPVRLTYTCQARLTRPARPHMRATRQDQPAHVRGKPGHAGSQPARPASCSPAQTLPRTIIMPATHTSCATPPDPQCRQPANQQGQGT